MDGCASGNRLALDTLTQASAAQVESGPKFLRPFFRYFGGKWKIAPKYPQPAYDTIVEPFAGSAGYSLRHYRCNVILVEKNDVVAEVWRYILTASARELSSIPKVFHVDELPAWVPQEGRWLVGFCLCAGDTRPRSSATPMIRRDGGPDMERIAAQAELVRHWKIIHGDYTMAGNVRATWFIDAPYQVAGARARRNPKDKGRVRYPNGADDIDFDDLAAWSRSRMGQVIVCENVGADWMLFEPLCHAPSVKPGSASSEAIYHRIDG